MSGLDEEVYLRETQFVPQEDDAEVLWEVIEITAEKPKFYKVRWTGFDPKTGKPWAQSWVAKRDCTDDLVLEWKRKQAAKKKGEGKKGNKRSTTSPRKSHAPSISVVPAIPHASTTSLSTTTKHNTRNPSAATLTGVQSSKPPKRSRSVATDDRERHQADAPLDDEQTPVQTARPRKKRKLTREETTTSLIEPESVGVRLRGKKKQRISQELDNEVHASPSWDAEPVAATNGRSSKGKGKAKQKQVERESSTEMEEQYVTPMPSRVAINQPNHQHARKNTTPTPTPEPEPTYVKFRSGKITTPKRKRRSPETVADSSSSDEVEMVVPLRSPELPPTRPRSLSPWTLERLREFDESIRTRTPEPEPSPNPVATAFKPPHDEDNTAHQMCNDYVSFGASPVAHIMNGTSPSNRTKDDSYRQGVVPETEAESSNNTQSQSQSQPILPPPAQPSPSQQSPPKPPLPTQPLFLPSSDSDNEGPSRRTMVVSPPLQTASVSNHDIKTEEQLQLEQLADPSQPFPTDHDIDTDAEGETDRGLASQRTTRSPEIEFAEVLSKPRSRLSRVPTLIVQHSRHVTPTRSSIISRMKPRTPGSSSHLSLLGDGPDIGFHEPELEVHLEVDEEYEQDHSRTEEEEDPVSSSVARKRGSSSASSVNGRSSLRPIPMLSPSRFTPHLPSSNINQSMNGSVASGAASDSDKEVAELVSSIEQFSSPEKGGRKRKPVQKRNRGKGKAVDEEPDSETRSLVTDGDHDRELEEAVRTRGPQLAESARLGRLRQHRGFVGEHNDGKKRKLDELVAAQQEKEKAHKSKQVLVPMREKGNVDKFIRRELPLLTNTTHLRQEEEEASQDIMMDTVQAVMEDVEMDAGWNTEPTRGDDMEVSEAAEPEFEPVPAASDHAGHTHSKSKSSSTSSRSGQRRPPEEDFILPPTAPTASLPPLADVEVQATVTPPPDYVATLALLNGKSQENALLAKEIEALREALAAATSVPQPQAIDLVTELEEARASRDAALASLKDAERHMADLARSKESVGKDRDFFREQYAKASGFVTSVREENKELEEQARIAKEQSTSGVEMIKATFATRLKDLEEQVRSWKRMAMFVMEKDVRTNDEIRRRAAEEPELRAKCEQLEAISEQLGDEVDTMRDELQVQKEQVQTLEQQLEASKETSTSLAVELSKVKAQLKMEVAYQCEWMVDLNTGTRCLMEFADTQELEAHMYTGNHLYA